MLTSTRSPASAACSAVPARASGPSSAASSASVSGPRELLSTTWCPAATLSLATVPPIIPLPMMPTVVMTPPTPDPVRSFREFVPRQRGGFGGHELAQGLADGLEFGDGGDLGGWGGRAGARAQGQVADRDPGRHEQDGDEQPGVVAVQERVHRPGPRAQRGGLPGPQDRADDRDPEQARDLA